METLGSLCSKCGWSLCCCRLFLQSESCLLLSRQQMRKQRVKAQNLSRLSLHDPVGYVDSAFQIGTSWHVQSAWSEACGQVVLLRRTRKLLMSPDLSLPSAPPPTDSGSVTECKPCAGVTAVSMTDTHPSFCELTCSCGGQAHTHVL